MPQPIIYIIAACDRHRSFAEHIVYNRGIIPTQYCLYIQAQVIKTETIFYSANHFFPSALKNIAFKAQNMFHNIIMRTRQTIN